MATREEIIVAFEAMNNDPEFQQLSYEEQQQARAQWAQHNLPMDPQFNQLPAPAQAQAFRNFVTAPPALAEATPWARQAIELAQRVRSVEATGRPDEEGKLTLPWQDPENRDAIEIATAMTSGRALSDRVGAIGKVSTWLGRGATQALESAGLVGEEEAQRIDFESYMPDRERNPEEYKAYQYLEQAVQNSSHTTGFENAVLAASPWIGLAGNIVSGRAMFGGALRAARAGGALRAATRSTSQFGKWMSRSVFPEVVESGIDAVMMTTADAMAKTLVDNSFLRRDTGSWVGNVAANFGSNFAGDMAFFGALSLVGASVGSTVKAFRKRGFGSKAAGSYTEEEFEGLVTRFLSGEDLDSSQFNSLPAPTKRAWKRVRREVAAAQHLDDAAPQDVARMVARSNGYEFIEGTDGLRLRNLKTGEEITGISSEQQGITKLFAGDFAPDRATQVYGAVEQNQFAVEQMATAKFGDELPAMDTSTLAHGLLPDRAGRLNPNRVQVAARKVVQQGGGDADTVRGLTVRTVTDDAYWKMADDARVQEKRIYVPERIKTADEMSRFMDRLRVDLGKYVPEGTEAVRRYVTDIAQEVPRLELDTNPMFVEATAAANGLNMERLPNGVIRLGDETGEVTVGSVTEAADVMKRAVLMNSDEAVHRSFGKQFGIDVVEEQGTWHARGPQSGKGGNILTGNHESVQGVAQELMEKGFVPKLGQAKAANITINAMGDGIDIWQKTLRGPREFVRDYAKSFAVKWDPAQVLERYGTNTIEKGSIKGTFRVVAPEWGVLKEFDSFQRAQDFLKFAGDSVENLREAGLMKGILEMQEIGGRVVIREFGQDGVKTFDSVKRAAEYVKAKEADPLWTKEISNFDESVIDSAIDAIDDPDLRAMFTASNRVPTGKKFSAVLDYMRQNETWKTPGPSGEYGSIKAGAHSMHTLMQLAKDSFQTPRYARIRRIVGQNGFDMVGDVFEAMEKNMKNARGLNAQASEVIHAIGAFDGAPSTKRRRKLRALLEVPDAEWESKARSLNFELTTGDKTYLERFRKASDGLGRMFGIDPYKMLNGWLPRFREWTHTKDGIDAMASSTRAHEVISKYSRNTPNEVKFFSENLRRDELAMWLDEADPQDILAKYAQKGIKNMTLGRTYNEQIRLWNQQAASGNVPNEALYTIKQYMESVMGMYTDEASQMAEQSARRIGEIMAEKAKAGPYSKAMRDLVSTFHGFTIAALMSFRPWPVIRNMQQVWTTLAPMFSNEEVLRVVKKVSEGGDWLENTYQRLTRSGRLQDRIPIYGMTYEGKGIMGLVNKVGMRFYKNSDDYTRIVVDGVVRDRFTDAVAKWQSGVVTDKQFVRLANLHRLDDYDQRMVMQLLQNEGFDRAVDYYGDIVTRETMFAYSAGANPAMFNGMWGRFFGMFGHYPVYYAQTLMNGLRRGNLLDKAKFVGRVASNSAMLWFAFEKVWGIRADDFVPWKTMFFDGGPYFKLIGNTLSAAAGAPGASFTQVRKDAARIFIPGSLMARSFAEGVQLAEQGDAYNGVLRMMSAPLAPDR